MRNGGMRTKAPPEKKLKHGTDLMRYRRAMAVTSSNSSLTLCVKNLTPARCVAACMVLVFVLRLKPKE